MRFCFFRNSKRLLESYFNYDARGGSPPPTHVGTPVKATFYSAVPLTEATALAISCKFGQSKA